ncbi:MAG: hypothetical protein QNJ30_23060 [Kiloniellales bacterium]|nr:hypothetical protein [Kiloniellales bacterium]
MTGHIFFWTSQIFVASYLAESLARDLGSLMAAVAVFGLCIGITSLAVLANWVQLQHRERPADDRVRVSGFRLSAIAGLLVLPSLMVAGCGLALFFGVHYMIFEGFERVETDFLLVSVPATLLLSAAATIMWLQDHDLD